MLESLFAIFVPGTSGEGFQYSWPLFPFPGVTRLTSTRRIGDASVGAHRWD